MGLEGEGQRALDTYSPIPVSLASVSKMNGFPQSGNGCRDQLFVGGFQKLFGTHPST